MKNSSIVTIAVLVCATLGGVQLYRHTKPLEVSELKIKLHENLVVFAEGEGQILSAQESFVTAIKGGKLENILVAPGATVAPNQILAVIDEASRTAKLRSALSAYQANSHDLERIRSLYGSGAATQQEWDDTRTKNLQLHAELEQAKSQLEDGVLRAPAHGRILTAAFQKGDFIPDGSRVFALENNAQSVLTFKLPYEFRTRLSNPLEIFVSLAGDTTRPEAKLSAPFELLNPESDFDGLFAEVRVQIPGNGLAFPKGRVLHVRVPIATYARARVVERRALVQRDASAPASVYVLDTTKHRAEMVPAKTADGVGEGVVLLEPNDDRVLLDPDIPGLEKAVMEHRNVVLR